MGQFALMLRPSTRARLILSTVEGEARAARDEEAQHEEFNFGLTLSLSKGEAGQTDPLPQSRYGFANSIGFDVTIAL